MKRGVIKFTNQELAFMKQLLSKESKELTNLMNRLSFDELQSNQELVDIFINEDEVETILDLLPLPTNANLIANQVRQKLRGFFD